MPSVVTTTIHWVLIMCQIQSQTLLTKLPHTVVQLVHCTAL